MDSLVLFLAERIAESLTLSLSWRFFFPVERGSSLLSSTKAHLSLTAVASSLSSREFFHGETRPSPFVVMVVRLPPAFDPTFFY